MIFRLVLVVSKFVVVWVVLLGFGVWPEMVAAQESSDGLVADTNSEDEEVLEEEVLEGVSGPRGVEDALLDMFAESYASDYSVSMEEARRRLGRIRPIKDTVSEIVVLESSRLAGFGIDHSPVFAGYVGLCDPLVRVGVVVR